MPDIIVIWNKVPKVDGRFMDVTDAIVLPASLRTEALVVLHGSRLYVNSKFGERVNTIAAIAVAFAEINSIESVEVNLSVLPKEPPADAAGISHPTGTNTVRVVAHCTRLLFRSGEPVTLLHPFDDVERLFTQYRIYAAKTKAFI